MSKEFEAHYREFCGVDDPDEIVAYDNEARAHFLAGQQSNRDAVLEEAAVIAKNVYHAKVAYCTFPSIGDIVEAIRNAKEVK